MIRWPLGIALLLSIGILIAPARHAWSAEAAVDTLQYMLQTDDKNGEWTINGTDTNSIVDPDRSGLDAFALSKFSNPNLFEIYQVTDADIRIRYEVYREGGMQGTGNWIRRFEEISATGPTLGAVWMKRQMVPGGGGFESHYRQDRFVYDRAAGAYSQDPKGSGSDFRSYISVVWAQFDPESNKTGFAIDKVLRMVSEWQTEGLIIETYDYALGTGLVNWRWLERLDLLRPVADDKTGKLFRCENGTVQIESRGSSNEEPVVYKYDLSSKTQGDRLGVVRIASHWKQPAGLRWYVVFRDLAKERPILKQRGSVKPSLALPEWKSKANATLADLPYVNTHKTKQ